jgi:hypothetical protein
VRGNWRLGLLAGLVLVAAVAAAVAIIVTRGGEGPSHPSVLNEPTKARQARPFTAQRDPRFDPYPLVRERHDK